MSLCFQLRCASWRRISRRMTLSSIVIWFQAVTCRVESRLFYHCRSVCEETKIRGTRYTRRYPRVPSKFCFGGTGAPYRLPETAVALSSIVSSVQTCWLCQVEAQCRQDSQSHPTRQSSCLVLDETVAVLRRETRESWGRRQLPNTGGGARGSDRPTIRGGESSRP